MDTNSAFEQTQELHFQISSGLKRVIGRDLITDNEVAILELVKNSFDAGASQVQIYFSEDLVSVCDNGIGMSRKDLDERWLRVAYSYKKTANERKTREGYRDHIAERHYAGSKGIGRFSSDRLGRFVTLQTRSRNEPSGPIRCIDIDWDLFERNDTDEFGTIPVVYREQAEFDIPLQMTSPGTGTVISISGCRADWDRSRILALKASLAKLINPFGSSSDGFTVEIIAPSETKRDQESGESSLPSQIVNGEVGNFIFDTLRDKTTYIEVNIDDSGDYIYTSLTDRGELVYRIREPNTFEQLTDSGFRCQLYYLNQSAKLTFARRMGLPSVQFGSTFLFRNGFRVFPIGEEGDDWFGIDRRKQQGYARFLGTRDVIGRIDVEGSENQFKEASSRNQGLIETEAVSELKKAFWDFCFKRLEKYVVPVTWADSLEKNSEDLSRLLTDTGRARVASAVARLVDNPDITLLTYSRKLISILNERSSQFEDSLTSLRQIALKTNDPDLSQNIERAEKRFEELRKAEAEAIRIAVEERKAKEAAQGEVVAAKAESALLTERLSEERKRTLFLASIKNLDTETIIGMHHQITIYSADMQNHIENFIASARSGTIKHAEVLARLEQIAFLNQKVLSVSRLATKANFRLDSDTIEGNLAQYIEQYICEVARPFFGNGINIAVKSSEFDFTARFRPMEISIIIDNFVSNARKAGAANINFVLSSKIKKQLLLEVIDDGRGLPNNLENFEQIFELGFSRTSGSGLGLYHVRQVLGEMGGSVSAKRGESRGTIFEVRFVS